MKGKMYYNMIKSLLKESDKDKYSHLIIIIDNSDYQNDLIKRFVKRSESIKDVILNITSIHTYKIKEIYNYDMNLEDQMNEDRSYHINVTYNKMNEALEFARKKHEGQTRENGSPYINHPIMVAKITEKFFKYDLRVNELITAAYLHDVLEDTNTSSYEILNLFGKYVTYLVCGVTNNDELKHNMGKTDYLCYKMLNMNDDILNLKLCDRLANVMDLRNASSEFREKYIAETLIIINFLIYNRTINSIELEIIKEINNEISNLRKEKILKYKFV